MTLQAWLPAIVRARPEQEIEIRYCTLAPVQPSTPAQSVADAVRAAGAQLETTVSSDVWNIILPSRTMVYGFIGRDVEEKLTASLRQSELGWELVIRCEPLQTHNAHAAGGGGVLLMAAAVWLTSGWVSGLLPGLTTLVGCGLWADVARVMAMNVLERRLRLLAEDLGSALWPGVSAQILPPPRRLGKR